MTSMNQTINQLHEAYCQCMAFELVLTASTERQWLCACNEGLTPDDLRLVITDRRKRIAQGVRHKECLLLRNLIGCEDRIADVLNEAAVARAAMRIVKTDPNKVSVLRATGRPDPTPQVPARRVSEVFEEIRKAAS